MAYILRRVLHPRSALVGEACAYVHACALVATLDRSAPGLEDLPVLNVQRVHDPM